MGHVVKYYTTDKRSKIMDIAKEFAFYNTNRGENPNGTYHGNLHIHDTPICDSYEDAMEKIAEWDTGWYSDHAVQYRDKDAMKPTKAMQALKAKGERILKDKMAYQDKHSVKDRKAEFAGCKNCGSKISIKHLRGERCPVCNADLRAEYILERIKKYDDDYKEVLKQYNEMKKKQSGKCPIRWLIKVEEHC